MSGRAFRRTALAAALLLAPAAAPAQVAPPIQNVAVRQTTSLDGAWRAIVDPFEAGYYTYRSEPSPWGYFLDQKPTGPSDLVEYDFDRAETLAVPGDWNSQRERLFFYEGTVWYRRSFDYPLAPGRRLFVHFGAVANEARVWLNGQPLGEHLGGYTPFGFEITGLVRPRGNSLVVKADNRRRADGVPGPNTDWWNYGGITREVRLVELPAAFVRDYALRLDPADPSRIDGWVELDGAAPGETVRVRLPEAGLEARATTDAAGRAALALPAPPRLWSPRDPWLYRVEIEAGADRVVDRIGFRTVTTRGADILLNGRPLYLRGVNLHEEVPGHAGRAFSAAHAERQLALARELGANFVRLAHYPHSEHVVRLADAMGLLVWAEIPVYWATEWGDPATYAAAERQLAELIARDRNRAAVIFWSVGNETPPRAQRLAFQARLAAAARRLDGTRLVTAALETSPAGDGALTVADPLAAHLDVIACNQYLGWYYGDLDAVHRQGWRLPADRPFLFSEFGADALAGLHGEPLTRWSEEFQLAVYEQQLRMFAGIPGLRGIVPWVLSDFRSPRRPLAGIQDYWNRKGLVSEKGERKAAFFLVQRHYAALAAARPDP